MDKGHLSSRVNHHLDEKVVFLKNDLGDFS